MPRLVLPSIKYKKSFLKDFLKHGEMQDEYALTAFAKRDVSKNFPQFINNLKLQSKGVYPKKGLVPQTVYWLVDGKKFLGKLSIRHKLNHHLRKIGGHIGYYVRPSQRGKGYGKQILRLGLRKAKNLGINNVLLTCNAANLKSKKVIEANGGKFENATPATKKHSARLRYWVSTKL